jgi:hypothetical protein
VAALAGLGCFALSVSLFPSANGHTLYGHPLIRWFAWILAHIRFQPTMLAFLIAGMALGAVQPRFWPVLAASTMVLPCLLNTINLVHDTSLDPTSHNLWPFEFVMLGILGFPAIPGAFFGSRIRMKYARAESIAGTISSTPPPLPRV